MTTPTDLLYAGTALPWRRSGPGPQPDGDQVWLVGDGNRAQFIAWTDASMKAIADFDLAARAVNLLPRFLTLYQEAATVVNLDESFLSDGGTKFPALQAAVAALSELDDA